MGRTARVCSWASFICFVHLTSGSGAPVADIIKRHNLTYHLYADDSQLYVSFKLGSDDLLFSAKSSIKIWVQEIKNWMILSGLRRKKPTASTQFTLSAQSFLGICSCWGWLFVVLEWYSIPVLILKNTVKRYTRHVISI